MDGVDDSSAEISWGAPSSDGGTPIQSYIVEVKSPKDNEWKKVVTYILVYLLILTILTFVLTHYTVLHSLMYLVSYYTYFLSIHNHILDLLMYVLCLLQLNQTLLAMDLLS